MALGRRTSGHDLRTFAAFCCQNITQEGLEITMTEDEKYQTVIEALPKWQPSRTDRRFGLTSIKSIVKCTLKEALELRNRLEYEGAIPTRTWND